jgi:hypothetical protein
LHECIGEDDDGEHLEKKDGEVYEVVGAEFAVAGGVKESVAESE